MFTQKYPRVYEGHRVIYCDRNLSSAEDWSVVVEGRINLNHDGVWALSDVAESDGVYVPCRTFLKSAALVVQATSPASERWSKWKKEQRAKLYVMRLWTVSGYIVLCEYGCWSFQFLPLSGLPLRWT